MQTPPPAGAGAMSRPRRPLLLYLCLGVAALAWLGCRAPLRGEAFAGLRGARRPHARAAVRAADHQQHRGEAARQAEGDYLGVTRHTIARRWQAHVVDPDSGELVSLGVFVSKKDAAQAYDATMFGLHGDTAETNFARDLFDREQIEGALEAFNDPWVERPSSKYVGVYTARSLGGKWQARVEMYGASQYLDTYDDEYEAALAADEAIRTTGSSKFLLLRQLNMPRKEDYFDEDTWENEMIDTGRSSRFMGVVHHVATDKYLARLGRKHVGLFDTELEAAKAFDKASHAKGGVTNFQVVEALLEA